MIGIIARESAARFGALRQAQREPTIRWLPTSEVAALLNVNPETIKRWLRTREMRGRILGDRGGWPIAHEAVRRLMREREPSFIEKAFGSDSGE